jgi:hypothetical protein
MGLPNYWAYKKETSPIYRVKQAKVFSDMIGKSFRDYGAMIQYIWSS